MLPQCPCHADVAQGQEEREVAAAEFKAWVTELEEDVLRQEPGDLCIAVQGTRGRVHRNYEATGWELSNFANQSSGVYTFPEILRLLREGLSSVELQRPAFVILQKGMKHCFLSDLARRVLSISL